MNIKPNLELHCDKFNNENFVLKLPNIVSYYCVADTLKNVLKGINLLSDNNIIEEFQNDRLNIIHTLSNFAVALDLTEECGFIDNLLRYEKLELSADEEKQNLKEHIKSLQQSNQNYETQIKQLKKTNNESNN